MKNNNTAIFENSARRTLHFAVTSRWPGTTAALTSLRPQPPPQALRFSHGRGGRETSDWWWTARDHGKGTDGRWSPLSPSRLPLRAQFHQKRDVWVRGRAKSIQTQWIGSVQQEKFRNYGSTFWGGPLFPVGPVGILVEWIAPYDSFLVFPKFVHILGMLVLYRPILMVCGREGTGVEFKVCLMSQQSRESTCKWCNNHCSIRKHT